MKTALVVLALAFAVYPQGRIESKYDRFTDQTTVILSGIHVFRGTGRAIDLDAAYIYKGNDDKIEPPHEIALRFTSIGSDLFSQSIELYVLADGERHRFNHIEFDFKTERRVTIFVPFHEFETILAAKKIEIRLGSCEVSLLDVDLKAIREFIPKPLK